MACPGCKSPITIPTGTAPGYDPLGSSSSGGGDFWDDVSDPLGAAPAQAASMQSSPLQSAPLASPQAGFGTQPRRRSGPLISPPVMIGAAVVGGIVLLGVVAMLVVPLLSKLSSWEKYVSVNGKYGVEMPVKAKTRTKTTNEPGVGSITEHIAYCTKGDFVYSTSHADMPPLVVAQSDAALAAWAEALGDNIRAQPQTSGIRVAANDKTMVLGYSGRSVRVQFRLRGKAGLAQGKAFCAGNRIYTMVTIGPDNSGSSAERFFDSFKLLGSNAKKQTANNKAAPSAQGNSSNQANTSNQGSSQLDEDYAKARRSFKTQLTKRGPAPQPADWNLARTPSGARALTYRSGGHSLKAYVSAPGNYNGQQPGLIFLHGGFAFGDGDWEMTEQFQKAGFAVMMPVLRGENNQPGHFTLYFDEVDDVLAAATAMGNLPYVDKNQLFLVGHSAGGSLTALAAMASDKFKAVAAFSGCMDQRLNADIAPFAASSADEFRIRSPLDFAKSFKCPTRLYYGSQERELGDGAKKTATAAKAAGLDVEATLVPGDHFTSVDPAIRRSLLFFRKFVKFPPRKSSSSTPSTTSNVAQTPNTTPPSNTGFSGSGFPNTTPPTTPSITPPNITPPNPFGGPSARPTVPTNPFDSKAVVVFEIKGYQGRSSKSFAAKRALFGTRWVNPLKLDFEGDQLIVGVRRNPTGGVSVNTGAAKSALQKQGFTVGSVSYKPNGQ